MPGSTAAPLLRVLIVEDDAGYSRLLRETLAEQTMPSYRVTAAASLEEALERLDAERFDAILLDLGLPDAGGLDALRAVRDRSTSSPVVVLSGQDDVDVALEAMRLGAQEYLVKGQLEGILLHRAIRYAIVRKRLQDFERLLIGVVSHDLRNPLHAIQLACMNLMRRPLGEREHGILARAARAADRAASLVGDLLDTTNLRFGGQLPMKRAEVDVAVLVEGVVEEFRNAHPRREIRFDARGDCTIDADHDRLAQLATNLVGNALQHSPADSAIEVRVSSAGDVVRLSVANGGPPIPEELRQRLFDPLQRAQLYEEGSTGSIGLGLYIVHEIVRAHCGEVDVVSSESAGTVFRVTLPCSAPAPAATARVTERRGSPGD